MTEQNAEKVTHPNLFSFVSFRIFVCWSSIMNLEIGLIGILPLRHARDKNYIHIRKKKHGEFIYTCLQYDIIMSTDMYDMESEMFLRAVRLYNSNVSYTHRFLL